jgi:hypothetical protein
MMIAIGALVGMVGGFIAGWYDDGPAMAFGVCVIGGVVGVALSLCLMAIFNPAFFH